MESNIPGRSALGLHKKVKEKQKGTKEKEEKASLEKVQKDHGCQEASAPGATVKARGRMEVRREAQAGIHSHG